METVYSDPVQDSDEGGGAPTQWQEFMGGLSAMAPLLVGVMPFGLIYGVLAADAGLPTTMAQGMSIVVFAGSAQFILTQLIRDHAPLLVMIATAAVVNLRHVLYSASLAPYLQELGRGWQALLAYLLTDEAYAVTITRYLATAQRDDSPPTAQPTKRHWHFLGAGLGLWITWQISTAIGIFLGAQVPDAWALDFTLPLTFIAIVMPTLQDWAAVTAAVVAGSAVLLTLAMPLKLGLVTAILAGIGAGYVVEKMTKSKVTIAN
ncbi:MAG: AzlC family ABC transporter permease [Caldilineaceae bacterium]